MADPTRAEIGKPPALARYLVDDVRTSLRYKRRVTQALSLFQPSIYLAHLERLQAKFASRRRSREPQSGGVSLSDLHARGDRLCDAICAEVRGGTYRFSPLERVIVFTDGKRRTIHRPNLVDAIVLGALAQRLTALFEPILCDDVYAYRPKRNPQLALTRVRKYLEQHREVHADPRRRGVFVLQRDLASYGESIPTEPDSLLWKLLDAALANVADEGEAHVIRSLVLAGCRPDVRSPNGETAPMTHGIPTGSPIQQPLANLYLTPLDIAVRRLHPGIYARFGDDILLIEPDLGTAVSSAHAIDDVVVTLGLTLNSDKTQNLYFTAPGRPLEADSTLEFRPTSHVEYLGVRLSFRGDRGLKRKRLRQLLARSRRRIDNTLLIAPSDRAVEFVAATLGSALHGNDSVKDPACEALRSWVDDRAQLRQIDYQLALTCAEAISKRRGARAFRTVSPQQLRAAGLPSLLELRRRSRGAR